MRARSRLVDLSHPVETGMPAYPGLPSPRVEPYISHAASRPAYGGRAAFEIIRVFLVGNTGTHLDSPYHREPDAPDIASLPLDALVGLPAVIVDAPDGARAIDAMPSGSVAGHAVLFRTGWSARWATPAYWDPAPFVSSMLARHLADARVALVGTDAWNVDDPGDPGRPTHTTLLGAGIPIVEHLTGLGALPPRGARFTAVPAPIRGCASFPVRAFAELPAGSGWRDLSDT